MTEALSWWGLRAYSWRVKGRNAVRLRESGGNTEQDFTIQANGGLDLAAIAAFKGANNLFVVTLYDQVSTINLFQTTAADQPAFILSGLGSLPVMRFNGAINGIATGGNVTRAQPLTISTVFNRTGAFTTATLLFGVQNFDNFIGSESSSNTFRMGSPTVQTATAADSTWHAIQTVFNGASGDLNVDGSVHSVSSGTNGFTTSILSLGQIASFGRVIGDVTEIGYWPIAFSSGNSSAMSSNQRTYWGF